MTATSYLPNQLASPQSGVFRRSTLALLLPTHGNTGTLSPEPWPEPRRSAKLYMADTMHPLARELEKR